MVITLHINVLNTPIKRLLQSDGYQSKYHMALARDLLKYKTDMRIWKDGKTNANHPNVNQRKLMCQC